MTSAWLLGEVLVIVGAAFAFAIAMERVGVPTIVGYVLAGIAIGPGGLKLVHEGAGLDLLAEVGVTFLMFYVGLEFSFPVLASLRRSVFLLGGFQVLAVGAAGTVVAAMLGVPTLSAVLIGGALAMSSTAICTRQLADQGDLVARHGRLVVGILLFQDLATLPLLGLAASLQEASGQSVSAEWYAFLRRMGVIFASGLCAFLTIAFAARHVFVRAMEWLAAESSRELFLLAVLLVVLGSSWAAGMMGLSLPLGAFFAGMALGETELKHRAEEEVRPFRDVLLGLFFVTVGLRVDPALLLSFWTVTLATFLSATVGKGVLTVAMLRALGEDAPSAVRAGVILGHGGELGLLLVSLVIASGNVPETVASTILGAVALSMLVAPFAIRHSEAIEKAILHRLLR